MQMMELRSYVVDVIVDYDRFKTSAEGDDAYNALPKNEDIAEAVMNLFTSDNTIRVRDISGMQWEPDGVRKGTL